MPRILIEKSRLGQVFYPVMLTILGVVYGGLGTSWVTTVTTSRVSGIAFMAPWFTPDVVGVMWLVAALCALIGAYISYRSSKAGAWEILLSSVVIAVPLILALIFFFSSFGVILDPSLIPSSHAWVTSLSYGGYAGLAAWSYLVRMSAAKVPIEQ